MQNPNYFNKNQIGGMERLGTAKEISKSTTLELNAKRNGPESNFGTAYSYTKTKTLSFLEDFDKFVISIKGIYDPNTDKILEQNPSTANLQNDNINLYVDLYWQFNFSTDNKIAFGQGIKGNKLFSHVCNFRSSNYELEDCIAKNTIIGEKITDSNLFSISTNFEQSPGTYIGLGYSTPDNNLGKNKSFGAQATFSPVEQLNTALNITRQDDTNYIGIFGSLNLNSEMLLIDLPVVSYGLEYQAATENFSLDRSMLGVSYDFEFSSINAAIYKIDDSWIPHINFGLGDDSSGVKIDAGFNLGNNSNVHFRSTFRY